MKLGARTLFLLPVMLSIAGAQSHPAFWRYVHPEARSLFGVDLQKAKDSPLGQRVQQELERYGVKQMASSHGVDFISQVDQILVSSPAGFEDADKARGEVPVVFAMAGKFDVPKLRKQFVSLGARRSRYKGVEVFQPKGRNTDMNAAIVNGTVLLLGDPKGIRLAVDHHALGAPDAARSEMFTRAAALSQLHDIWWVSELSPSALAGAGLPQAEMFQAVRGFEGGVSLREGLSIALSLRTDGDGSSKQMGAALQALVQLAAASVKEDQPEVKEFLGRLRIAAGDGLVNASIAYTPGEITQTFEKVMAARMGPGVITAGGGGESVLVNGDGDSTAPTTLAAAPKQEEKFVVRIFNAEGGTREVPIPRY
ncbi:MAG: hypothetical protein R2762_18630 [Bryobacteraceae bacterium]